MDAVADRYERISVEVQPDGIDRIVAHVTYRNRTTGEADRLSLLLRSP